MIKKCIRGENCVSPYQDQKYGKGFRIHNERKKSEECTCTVCGQVSSARGAENKPTTAAKKS